MDRKQIARLIRRVHPEYESMVPHWDFLEATYAGGRAWFKENIFPYFKEGPEEYQARVDRAYRFNHTREVVDLVNKYVFRAEVARNEEDAPPSVREFWKNVDGSGTNIDEFMTSVSQRASVLGCPWIVVDSKVRSAEGQSKADEQPGSIYAYLVKPQQVRDLSWGEDGKLRWILIEELVRDDRDPFESSGAILKRYRLWTRERWYLFEQTGRDAASVKLTDSGVVGIGEVPVFRASNTLSQSPYTVPALINDIAYLDRAVANYLSNLDTIIQDQTFSQLAIPHQNLMPGDDAYKKVLEMGTKRVFVYDGEGGAAPMFLSPDPRQAQLIISAIQQIINEIYHSVGLAGERTKQDNAKGIDNSSGVAKEKDFERVNALLVAKGQALETVENQLVRLVALYAGEESALAGERELVQYPRNFDVRDLYDEFYIAMQLALMDVPALMRAEQMIQVADKLFPQRGEELRERLRDEINHWKRDIEEQRRLSRDLEALRGQVMGEISRDREVAGERQSRTKARRETGTQMDDRETGR